MYILYNVILILIGVTLPFIVTIILCNIYDRYERYKILRYIKNGGTLPEFIEQKKLVQIGRQGIFPIYEETTEWVRNPQLKKISSEK